MRVIIDRGADAIAIVMFHSLAGEHTLAEVHGLGRNQKFLIFRTDI